MPILLTFPRSIDRGPIEACAAGQQARMVREFTRANTCDQCYVSIRSYLDKPFAQLLWENVSGFFTFKGRPRQPAQGLEGRAVTAGASPRRA